MLAAMVLSADAVAPFSGILLPPLPDFLPEALRRRLRAWYAARRPGGREPAAKPPALPPPLRAPAQEPLARRLDEVRRQADRVEALRREAHSDPVSGLPNRRHFLGRLGSMLGQGAAPERSLLLLRALNLQAQRLQIGEDAVERRLALIGEALDAYPQHVPGAFAGRLNDSDFALCLPAVGIAAETAATLLEALRATPAAGPGGIEIVVGGVDGLQGDSPGEALAAADQALARAEAGGPFCIEIHAPGEAAFGEQAWRTRIAEALQDGRARLGEFAVVGPDRRLRHLECPLRLQLEVGGPYCEAQRWLAMATRSRLLPRVDLLALELALLAIVRDGRERCVHVGALSLLTPGFVGEVRQRLASQPEAAARLLIDVSEGAWLDRALPRLKEAGLAWRRHGVRLGVEHAGASMHALSRLAGVGLDHVRVEARFVRGVAAEPRVHAFAVGLVELVHGMKLQLVAEGVDDEGDAETLFAIGFDAATGPALRIAA
ncbi:diguanylate cyclase [Rubrivivax gelatinosus]|uniref:Diguanylate cyclase n=1 Tax=Rubrivivax gelatinosus TaxID=28068 RepID=A0ABS1DSR0_RUBGE|nr:EAL domain-containing protein [Rubrivivax gelatinosus]MBK1611958.1 diguanylate cyclase [Rubrivivax gelatinosus]MBK1712384.1 diguanylate cyclase [Rubrivivax gelatinosus]